MNDALFHAVNGLAGRWAVVDWAGEGAATWLRTVLLVVVFALPFWRLRTNPREGRAWLVTTLAAVLITHLLSDALKAWTAVDRPFVALTDVRLLVGEPSTMSMPSGHASMAAALAVSGSLQVRRLAPLLLTAALLVAFGRVFVGVHYPADVAVGLLLGGSVAALCRWVVSGRAERRTPV